MLERHNTFQDVADLGRVTHIGTLNVKISAFNYYHNTPADNTRNMVTVAASASYAITAAAASYYVYVVVGATSVAHAVTLPAKAIPLALVTTNGTKITAIVDKRAMYSSPEVDWTSASQNLVTTGNVTAADITSTDDVVVGDDLTVAGDIALTGNLVATGNLTAADITSTDDIVVGDDLSVGGDLAVTGSTTLGSVVNKAVDSALTGFTFTRTSTTVVTMSATGIAGKWFIPVSNGSTLLSINSVSDLTFNTATSGAGGIDTGSVAVSKGYYIYLITKVDGTVPLLLGSLSSTSPTMPATYTHKSKPIWFTITRASGTDLVDFIDINGACRYGGIRETILLSGTSTSVNTAVNCTGFVPANSIGIYEIKLVNGSPFSLGGFYLANYITLNAGTTTSGQIIQSRAGTNIHWILFNSYQVVTAATAVAQNDAHYVVVPSGLAGTNKITKATATVLTAGHADSSTIVDVQKTSGASLLDSGLLTLTGTAVQVTNDGHSSNTFTGLDTLKIIVTTATGTTKPQGLIVSLSFVAVGPPLTYDYKEVSLPVVDPATSLTYAWASAPSSGGASILAAGFILDRGA